MVKQRCGDICMAYTNDCRSVDLMEYSKKEFYEIGYWERLHISARI